MKTYFEAYRERLQRVNNTLLSLAHQLKNEGYTVYVNRDGFANFIKVFKGNSHILIGFTEVPYRWYAQISLVPSHGNGSCRTIDQNYDLENGYSLDEVKKFMRPYPFRTEQVNLDKQLFYLTRL